jgi:uncharacterized protein (TIGR02145 family)
MTENTKKSMGEVTIGSQVWTSTNLDVSTFRNGDPIPQAKTDEEWKKAEENGEPAWCYNDNDPSNGTKYGKLYNWHAVNDPRGLAPNGYHIPTDAEWTILTDYLGGEDNAGTKMKSTSGWLSYESGGSKTCPNCEDWNAEYRKKVPCHTCKDTRSVPAPTVTHSSNGTNSSGFSGLPGGFRDFHGPFGAIGYFGVWWSSSEDDAGDAWGLGLKHKDDGYGEVERRQYYYDAEASGFSVRCLRD